MWYNPPQIKVFVVFIIVRLRRDMEVFYLEELKLPLISFSQNSPADTFHWLYSGIRNKNNLLERNLKNAPEKC